MVHRKYADNFELKLLYNYWTDKKNRRRPRHSIVFWYYPTQSRTGNPMTSITSMAKCCSYPSGSSADVTTSWRRHQIGLPFLIFPQFFWYCVTVRQYCVLRNVFDQLDFLWFQMQRTETILKVRILVMFC